MACRAVDEPAITYFRTFGHYHRPRLLNGRVRNGNACFQPGMVTGRTRSPEEPNDRIGRLPKRSRRKQSVWQCDIDLTLRRAGLFVSLRQRNRHGKTGAVSKSAIADIGDETEMVKRLPISTGPLRMLPSLHFPPINLVVFEGALSKSYLEKGFALRCFQRLSVPHVATLHCLEQDNRNTRGVSF